MSEIIEIEIFFEDIKEERQKEILEELGIKSPKELNWDVCPIALVVVDTGELKEASEVLDDSEEPIHEDPAGLFDKVEEE